MHFFLAALLLAQVTPPMGIPRMPAQGPPTSSNDGITVNGSGRSSANATSAQVTLHFSSPQNVSITPASLQPVVDALVRSGVGRNDIIEPPYIGTPAYINQASLTFTVQHPTLAQFQNGVMQIGTAISGSRMNVNDAMVVLRIANCAAVLQQAQRAALASARANAQSIASQIGASLGPVLAVDARSSSGASGDECTYTYSINPYNPPPMAPAEYFRVPVSAAVTVRYAIKH